MEQFLTDNSIYVVLAIVLIIWFGIGAFLMNIERKISKMEKNMDNHKGEHNE